MPSDPQAGRAVEAVAARLRSLNSCPSVVLHDKGSCRCQIDADAAVDELRQALSGPYGRQVAEELGMVNVGGAFLRHWDGYKPMGDDAFTLPAQKARLCGASNQPQGGPCHLPAGHRELHENGERWWRDPWGHSERSEATAHAAEGGDG